MKKFLSLLSIILLATTLSTNIQAQSREGSPLGITTHHPDFKIKIKRCDVSGKTAVIDMIWENIGDIDAIIDLYYYRIDLYDDEGNKYSNTDISCSIGNKNLTWENIRETLYSGVPVKVRIQVENVDRAATMFTRCNIGVICDEWNLDPMYNKKYVVLSNVPISRN